GVEWDAKGYSPRMWRDYGPRRREGQNSNRRRRPRPGERRRRAWLARDDRLLALPFAQAPRKIAQPADRQRQVIFAADLPALGEARPMRRRGRHVPAVVLVAARRQIAVLGEIADVILEQDQPRPPAREVEAAQHLDLVAFDVDRQEIEARRRARLLEHAVERPDRHLYDAFRRGARRHALAVERRQGTRDMQRQAPPGVLRRRAGDGEDAGGAVGAQFGGELGLRLDQHAAPAGLLEVKGLRALARIVGADLDEIALGVAEEGGDQPRLMVGGPRHGGLSGLCRRGCARPWRWSSARAPARSG